MRFADFGPGNATPGRNLSGGVDTREIEKGARTSRLQLITCDSPGPQSYANVENITHLANKRPDESHPSRPVLDHVQNTSSSAVFTPLQFDGTVRFLVNRMDMSACLGKGHGCECPRRSHLPVSNEMQRKEMMKNENFHAFEQDRSRWTRSYELRLLTESLYKKYVV